MSDLAARKEKMGQMQSERLAIERDVESCNE